MEQEQRDAINFAKDRPPGTESEYRSFMNARNRCRCKADASYGRYGGKGIEFRFTSFKEFLDHIGRKPTPLHTLDRKDSRGHYEIGNVRWATRAEQAANRSSNHPITYKGVTKLQFEWNKDHPSLRNRLLAGYCVPCALEKPPRHSCHHRNDGRRKHYAK